MTPNIMPQARETGLVMQELEDELLVYDLDRNKAHCLTGTVGLIWRNCDGNTSVPELTTLLQRNLNVPVDDEVVWVALQRLGKAHLLTAQVTPPTNSTFRSSRRELMRKLSLVGGVAVISIIAPTAYAASTGCDVQVSCKHACISDHKADFPCPGGVADQQKDKCCNSKKICVQTQSSGTNNSGSCSGVTCC